MPEVTVYHPIWAEQTFNVPDKCPKCRADLTAEKALNEDSYVLELGVVTLKKDGYMELVDNYGSADFFETAYRCRACNADLVPLRDLWKDDSIQFARLLAEIGAAGFMGWVEAQKIGGSMHLEYRELDEIFRRASAAWEKLKAEHYPDDKELP